MHVYLIHGGNEVQIQSERLRLVDQLLPPEQRDENLTEFSASGNRPLVLSALLPDLLSELGTVSFFPGARRVAIVHNLSDFWTSGRDSATKSAPAAKGKKAAQPKSLDAAERLIRYFDIDFESTENAVIFTVFEDPNKNIEVDSKKKLYQWIKSNGTVRTFEKAKKAAFALGDAILDKNLDEALAQLRLAYRKGQTDQAMAVFSTLQRQVRLLLQAKIATSVSARHGEAFVAEELLPRDTRSNVLKAHPFVKKRMLEASRYFNIAQLTQAMQDLYEINRYMIPLSTDLHVADIGLLMEKMLIRLCSRTS